MALDQDKLMDFLHHFVGDLGATITAGNVVIGHRLGLYRALAPGAGDARRARRARPARDPRYVAEWLRGQAAGGYVDVRPRRRTTLLDDRGAGLRARPTPTARCTRPARSCSRSGALRGRAADHRGVPHRRGHRLARARRRRVRRLRAVLPPRLHRQPGRRAGSRRSTASRRSCAAGAQGRRHRLRARRLDDAAGGGVPGAAVRRLGLPRRLDRAGPQAGRRRRRRRPGHLRGGQRADVRRHRLRPGDDVRLPARHGRPAAAPRGTSAQALAADGTLADRRARCAGDDVDGQPQPGRPRLLRLLDLPVRAERAVAAGRLRARRAGRRGARSAEVVTDAGFTRFRRASPRRRSTSSTRPVRNRSAIASRAPEAGARDARRTPACARSSRRSRNRRAGRRRASPTRCSATASRPSCCCRDGDRGLARVEGAGARAWPATPGWSRSTRAATAGRTGRPTRRYADREYVADALAVLDAARRRRAPSLVGLSTRRRAYALRWRPSTPTGCAAGPASARGAASRRRRIRGGRSTRRRDRRHRRGLGEAQPALLARGLPRLPWSSSSASCFPSRTRRSRSRTASAGRWRPTPRC